MHVHACMHVWGLGSCDCMHACMCTLTIRTTLFPVSAMSIFPHASKPTLPIGALSVALVAALLSPA